MPSVVAKVTALGNKVIVVPDEAKDRTEAGIIIPESAQDEPLRGTVVSVGDEARGSTKDLLNKAVVYSKYSGRHFVVGGQKFVGLDEDEVLACVE